MSATGIHGVEFASRAIVDKIIRSYEIITAVLGESRFQSIGIGHAVIDGGYAKARV